MEYNLLDCIIALIIIISAVSGYRQGFIDAIGRIVGLIAGTLMAVIYYDNLALYMEDYYGVISSLGDFLRTKIPITVLSLEAPWAKGAAEYGDAAGYMAYLLIIALSFIVIWFISSKVVHLLWSGLDNLFSWGILSAINGILGGMVVVVKSILIITLLIGLIHPALDLAAGMGFYGAILALDHINNSVAANFMIGVFDYGKSLMGISFD